METGDGTPVSLEHWDTVYENNWWKMQSKDGWHILTSSTQTGCSVVLLLDEIGQVLLVENPRVAIGRPCLELPRGGIDPGEAPVDAAVRECFEETGVLVSADQLVPMGIIYPDSGILNHQAHLFCAQIQGPFPEPSSLDESEISGHQIISMKSFLAMIMSGEINDSFTIAAERRLSLAREAGAIEMDFEVPTSEQCGGETSQIEILNEENAVVTTITTDTPEVSFEAYCRNRSANGWSWRSKA
jgi:8-oxo-dGTP pyrophosphatase MutT (NUDIX family)